MFVDTSHITLHQPRRRISGMQLYEWFWFVGVTYSYSFLTKSLLKTRLMPGEGARAEI